MSKIFPNINNSDFHIIANKNDKTKLFNYLVVIYMFPIY